MSLRFKARYAALWLLLLCSLSASAEEVASPDALEQGLQELAAKLASRMSAREVKKLAIVEFSDLSGFDSALGLFLAEELTTLLLETEPGSFDIVERQQLSKVLQEQSLTASALFDAETIADVGEILGIQAVISGSIADLGTSIKINARCISVETALVFAAASTKVPKAGVVDHLIRQGAAPGSGSTPSTASANAPRAQASDAFFQNSFVRFTVASLGLSEDRKQATVALNMENLTTEPLYLALERDSRRCNARLIDDQGAAFSPSDWSPRCVNGVGTQDYEDLDIEGMTAFSPKARSTLVIVFATDAPVKGVTFALSLDFLRKQDGKISRFSAGISNIRSSR